MSVICDQIVETASPAEIEISLAAVHGYGRLLRAVGHQLQTHPTADGGLICEDRIACWARPTMWRILSDGKVLADNPYSYALGDFAPGTLPAGL
ncbi:MAG TPA: hypothetical protein VHX62_03580 [Solirubrobacteraceae bacterium]|jgi:hypothetical protein|nr:hypothetical protein [Solirubrobacteraceae bacterium]